MKKLIVIFAIVLMSQIGKAQMILDSNKIANATYLDTTVYKFLPNQTTMGVFSGIAEDGIEHIFGGYFVDSYLIVPIEIKKLNEFTKSFDNLYIKTGDFQWAQDVGYSYLYANIYSSNETPNYFYIIISEERK